MIHFKKLLKKICLGLYLIIDKTFFFFLFFKIEKKIMAFMDFNDLSFDT